MSEINIKLKSITRNSLDDLNIDLKYHQQALYGKVYWKIMGSKSPFVEYEKATPDILLALNTELSGERGVEYSFWTAESDNDGDVVYVYRPRNYWYKYDNQDQAWTNKFPPTEYAVGGPEEAKSYSHPRDMSDYNNLVLLVEKPSEEKRLVYTSMSRGDYTAYTRQEFIKTFGEEMEWNNDGMQRPISFADEERGADGYVKIPERSFTEYLWGYLEEGSEVIYFFKMRNPPPPPPQPPIGGGKRKSKRKSKRRKSKKRKSRTRRRSR